MIRNAQKIQCRNVLVYSLEWLPRAILPPSLPLSSRLNPLPPPLSVTMFVVAYHTDRCNYYQSHSCCHSICSWKLVVHQGNSQKYRLVHHYPKSSFLSSHLQVIKKLKVKKMKENHDMNNILNLMRTHRINPFLGLFLCNLLLLTVTGGGYEVKMGGGGNGKSRLTTNQHGNLVSWSFRVFVYHHHITG